MLNHLWVEKYRPKTLDDVILDDLQKAKLKEYLEQGTIPHLAFHGPPGTGKSTIAKIIRNSICKSNDDYVALNASLHGRIDTIRNIILPFLKTPPLASKQKIVYFEEFDNTSIDAQLALREPIETGSKNASFVITFNYINRVDKAILSRMQIFTISAPPLEACIERCEYILKNEGVEYNLDDVIKLVSKLHPNLRDIIKHLQMFTINGKFSYNDNVDLNQYEEVKKHIKQLLKLTNYNDMRRQLNTLVKIIAKQSYIDYPALMYEIFNDEDLELELRVAAGGYIDSIKTALYQEAAFANALWNLINLKLKLVNGGLSC